jgi:dihydroorotate dehydrogenase electron transfer subunit
MRYELPVTLKIDEVKPEAEGIVSVLFRHPLAAKAGQFVMLWLPGVDAKPVGVSYQTDERFGVTVSAVGNWSKQVIALKPGQYVGIFGPYGNGFALAGRRIVLVGGGYGSASLMLLAEEALRRRTDVTIIVGARTEKALLYRERAAQLKLNAIFTTDDGTFGEKGYNTAVLERLLQQGGVDTVYTCGPELMEKKVAEICRAAKVPAQISLERHMKCGFGVCGACCVDPSGQRICLEGPVFSGEATLKIAELGCFHRDGSAKKHYF